MLRVTVALLESHLLDASSTRAPLTADIPFGLGMDLRAGVE